MTGEGSAGQIGLPFATNPRRAFVYRSFKKIRHRIGEPIARASKVGNDPVLDPRQFPWIGELEREMPNSAARS
jgi:hypothetical protein